MLLLSVFARPCVVGMRWWWLWNVDNQVLALFVCLSVVCCPCCGGGVWWVGVWVVSGVHCWVLEHHMVSLAAVALVGWWWWGVGVVVWCVPVAGWPSLGGWLVVGVVVFCWIVDASIFVACCCLLCASVCAALWWCGWGCVVGVASVQGRMVDALASRADEGRWSLRKALGSWQPSCDPGMSEWGNLAGVMSSHLYLNS